MNAGSYRSSSTAERELQYDADHAKKDAEGWRPAHERMLQLESSTEPVRGRSLSAHDAPGSQGGHLHEHLRSPRHAHHTKHSHASLSTPDVNSRLSMQAVFPFALPGNQASSSSSSPSISLNARKSNSTKHLDMHRLDSSDCGSYSNSEDEGDYEDEQGRDSMQNSERESLHVHASIAPDTTPGPCGSVFHAQVGMGGSGASRSVPAYVSGPKAPAAASIAAGNDEPQQEDQHDHARRILGQGQDPDHEDNHAVREWIPRDPHFAEWKPYCHRQLEQQEAEGKGKKKGNEQVKAETEAVAVTVAAGSGDAFDLDLHELE
jgi:hypothetical protein